MGELSQVSSQVVTVQRKGRKKMPEKIAISFFGPNVTRMGLIEKLFSYVVSRDSLSFSI